MPPIFPTDDGSEFFCSHTPVGAAMSGVVRYRLALLLASFLLALVGGCAAVGPKALEQSHGAYNEAVKRVEEEQLLRNLLHVRYNESPSQLEVASIAAQYELTAHAEARPFFAAESVNSIFRGFSRVLPDAFVAGAIRPTLSLNPADDGSSVRRFLTPIPPDTLVLLARTGWPISTVLRLWVERLGGLPNAVAASGPARSAVPDFARFNRVV